MFTPRVGRHCTFIVTGRAVRSERFCGKRPKYERPFFERGTSQNNKTDEDALRLKNAKYTFWIILAQKYLMALQKCTLSGTAGG